MVFKSISDYYEKKKETSKLNKIKLRKSMSADTMTRSEKVRLDTVGMAYRTLSGLKEAGDKDSKLRNVAETLSDFIEKNVVIRIKVDPTSLNMMKLNTRCVVVMVL